jgi:hypothetical protein
MKNNLTHYHYLILNESCFDENNLIEIIQRHYVTGERSAIDLLNEIGINKPSLINLRSVAKNLISKYYLCHNNKTNNKL